MSDSSAEMGADCRLEWLIRDFRNRKTRRDEPERVFLAASWATDVGYLPCLP